MRHYIRQRDEINKRRRQRYKMKGICTEESSSTGCRVNCSTFPLSTPTVPANYESFIKETHEFESKLQEMNLAHCIICRQFRLGMQTTNNICSRCNSNKNKFLFSHQNKALPTWMKGDQVMYDIPQELLHLSMAEKLLIQRVSPLVPVIHIKNGILGVRGHIVSFFQDIASIATVLPRLPSEVSIVKVIRDSKSKCGNQIKKAFTVNRRKVLSALLWLKKHNILYKDIDIDESRLDWMNNCKKCELKRVVTISSESSLEDLSKDR